MHLAKFKRHLPVALIDALFLGTVIGVQVHTHWRSHLPPVAVRGDMIICRMKDSDFRFPLPAGTRDIIVGPARVGPDTIAGGVFVKDADNTAPYEEVLRRHNFRWKNGSPMAISVGQPGGWVWPSTGGRIDFSYFGDR
jgi:hypothetical protein